MGKPTEVTVLVVLARCIGERDKVQLLLASRAGRVDREKDRHANETPDDACHDGDFEEPKEQESVKG